MTHSRISGTSALEARPWQAADRGLFHRLDLDLAGRHELVDRARGHRPVQRGALVLAHRPVKGDADAQPIFAAALAVVALDVRLHVFERDPMALGVPSGGEGLAAPVSVRRQCELLRVSRSGLYYEALAESAEDLELMRQIDEMHLRSPFYGSRKIGLELRGKGFVVNRKRVQRLMRFRSLKVTKPNQVWAADITYIPMKNGFMYLVVIMDWYSRRALSWRLSNTMDPAFCMDALQDAPRRHGKPEIFNTDQVRISVFGTSSPRRS